METSVAGASVYREVVAWDGGVVVGKTQVVQGETSQWAYGYDEALRLTEAKKDGVANGSWAYDSDGNRVTANGVSGAYDGQDRLTSLGGATYQYDAFGSRRWKVEGPSAVEYRYQGPGELSQVVLPDGTSIEYIIDYRGRRIGKRKNGAFQVGWVYDGQLRIVGEVNATGTLTSRYVYGTLGHSPDVMVRGGVTYRYVHDALGSVRLVVNAATGEVAQRIDYDAWGLVEKDTKPGFQPFGYAGGLYDVDTSLVRFGARDYDAATGVWLSPESLAQSPTYVAAMAQDGLGVPTYAYALNNPLVYVDVDGLAPKDKLFGLPKKFWNWYHRKVKGKGAADLGKEEAEELHREWVEAGKPGPDAKCDTKSPTGNDVVDDILDLILPVPPIINPCLYDPNNPICRRGPVWELQ